MDSENRAHLQGTQDVSFKHTEYVYIEILKMITLGVIYIKFELLII